MNSTAAKNVIVCPAAQRQRGFMLLLMLVVSSSVGALGLFARSNVDGSWRTQLQRTNAAALASAREALIAHAISYLERHPGQDYGYLPCPDGSNSGSSSLGACGVRDAPASGRLPWRTLALRSATIGAPECLWYAVAGSVKHNPKPLALNWDSPGQFSVRNPHGQRIALPGADARAVALIIAPGSALDGQQRPAAEPCRGAREAALAWPDFIDSTLERADDGSWQIAHGLADSSDNNDLLSWLSVDDIFAALRRRSDFAAHIQRITRTAADALAARLDDADFISTHSTPSTNNLLRHGLLPAASALDIDAASTLAHNNWRDQFRFALCAAGDSCIELLDLDGNSLNWCRAALLFGGERIRSGPQRQQRLTAAERADPAQYLEGDNPTNLIDGIPRFQGGDAFTVRDPNQPASEDVIQCLR